MIRNRSIPVFMAATLFALAANAQNVSPGQGSPQPVASGNPVSPAEASKATVRIQVVINRFEGEKKIGSLPYTFVVTPNTPFMHIRFGVDVPVPVAGLQDQGKSGPVEYRNLGTNIDCNNVRELSGGRYQFDISLQNSAALPGPDGGKDSRPLFRRFETNFTAVLRDGQSMQTIASTNPVTGEVIKIDVTLSIVR
jgi:hypothetical protein